MDSGSSGSIQSSSGGEEEYDSRAEGFSGFLNKPPGHVGPMATTTKANPSPPATHHLHSSSSLFDPFSNFLDPLPTRSHQNSIPNLDFLWPRNPRSDLNPIQLPGSISMPPSSSQPQSYMTATNSQVHHQATETNVVHQAPRGLTLTTDRSDVVPNNTNNNTAAGTPSNNASVRNPRKRTRASRRAPTTILTTDTSNFRAMVQEFTGIPAPPFTPASSFPRARLDLFGGSASTSSPPYLLRPFPQKPSTSNSLLSPSSDFLLPKQNHHLPPMSSIFNLQPPPPPPLHQPNINLLASDQPTAETHRNHPLHQTPLPEELLSGSGNILPATWGSGGNGGGGGGGGASDQALFRSMNSKYCTGTKLNNNYSASSSSLDFHGDKGSENVTTRSEGMIESWICSSD
ncbi:protein transport protein SEC31-like [Benincasa hispida]|uniref:protein transport protein SEC31-like n=1 Tax=Benincasa hispida TaxID=102211 RepID=UPI001900940F|nr:protein transport protein SEC31-like [Benincasa hispida]